MDPGREKCGGGQWGDGIAVMLVCTNSKAKLSHQSPTQGAVTTHISGTEGEKQKSPSPSNFYSKASLLCKDLQNPALPASQPASLEGKLGRKLSERWCLY